MVRKEYRPFIDVLHDLPVALKAPQVAQEVPRRYGWALLSRVQYNLLKSIGFFGGSTETR
jgi:hypothetical protein